MKFTYDLYHVCKAINSLIECEANFTTFTEYDSNGTLGITIMLHNQDEFFAYFKSGYNPYCGTEFTWKETDDGFGYIKVNQAGVSYEFCPLDEKWSLK